MPRPILDDLELELVQDLSTAGDEVLTQHAVPALEGDFFQRLGRRATGISLQGVLTGTEVRAGLEKLREKFRAAAPVSFVADITTATRLEKVLIEELHVRELAGKPERFEYAFKLREFLAPPEPEEEEPPPIPPEPLPETATLAVEVIVDGEPNFDFSTVTVTVEGTQSDGATLPSRTLSDRRNNVWTEVDFPPGNYTAKAVVTEPPAMAGSEPVVVPAGGTGQATITLRRDRPVNIATMFMVHFRFDKAFIEPCMREVLREVADYAKNHPDEKLLIVGHTDEVGDDLPGARPPLYNQSLSERRARSAYAYLTFGRDRGAAIAEWDQLRRNRTTGVKRTISDTWSAREYQYMLQDLGYYSGNVNGVHDNTTDQAVRAFQTNHGLNVDGNVGDQTWPVLIEAYMAQDNLDVEEAAFFKNAKEECDSGILKWLGCGEEDPVRNTQDAWRPNRRTEFLFVQVDRIPCEAPKPDTFDLPTPGGVNSSWCLGPDNPDRPRCCFVIPNLAPEEFEPEEGQWQRVPIDPRTIPVRGSIKFEDGTPLANAKYFLIAPDGEFMDGEHPTGADRGKPNIVKTDANGEFDYGSDRLKPAGVYTMEIQEPVIARFKSEPAEKAKGNVVCARLEGGDFDVVLCNAATTFDLQVSGASQIGGVASGVFIAIRSLSDDVIVTAAFSPGTCSSARSIVWLGGEEVPGNPLQRKVKRANIGVTHVTATLNTTGFIKSVDVFVVRVTLDVDADRDGVVEEDGAGKNTWEFGVGKKGAVILCNNDDDNSNAQIDSESFGVDDAGDVGDLVPLVIRQSGALPPGVQLLLSVSDRTKIRIFNQRSATATAIIGPGPGFSAQSAITNNVLAEIELGMEATQYANAAFDGLIRLTLTLQEGGAELAKDEAVVRVAPWLMPSHLNVTEELYVVDISGFNDAFVAAIEAIATATGVPLRKASGFIYNDQWIQDSMEVGFSLIPGKQNPVILNAIRFRELEPFAQDELLGPDYGYVEVATAAPFSTFDSHGNVEVSPPVTVGGTEFKFGRIYYGKGRTSTPFNADMKAFLERQLIQKPFELDTDWLGVGHVDEIISFIPANVGKSFRMLFASVDEAIRILTDLRSSGHGDLTLFTGKIDAPFHERTINSILSDPVLMADNTACQARLNAVETMLVAELGLDPITDIIKIPSLFVVESLIPRLFAALIPGMVNTLVITRPSFANTKLVIPKPFGPVLGGVDQLEQDVLDRLTPLGYTTSQIHFVDDFDTYHINLGEVHCGTNSKRAPYTTPWWEQEVA